MDRPHDGTTVSEPESAIVVPDAESHEGRPSTGQRLVAWGSRLRPSLKGLSAYLLFQVLAFAIWVVPILHRFNRQHLGAGLQDSRYNQWAISWTPFAISHGLNPLHMGYLFPPTGVDLAWSTFLPGPALATWPVTSLFGPMASLNLLMAAAPALAAWGAYLVCYRLTHRFWASLLGGYLFGFTAYMAGNAIGFVNLMLVFPIPLLVYLVIRRVEGSLGPVAFVAGSAALLVGLFSISTEMFGTATIFGAFAFAGSLAFGKEIRGRLLHTGGLILVAGGVAAVVLSPYLYDVVANRPATPFYPPDLMAAPDLWSFIVPPPYIRLGGDALLPLLSRHTVHPVTNGLGYVSVAIPVMLIGFAITERRRRTTWALLSFVAFVALLALGPVLHVGGSPHGWLPESLLANAPIIQSATPARFLAYSSLAIGVIAALWLSRAAGPNAWIRWAVVITAAVLLLPAAPNHAPPQVIPQFFSSGEVRQVLRQREIVYAITDAKGDEVLWQATANYWFDLAQGYIGPLPLDLRTGPLSGGLSMRRDVFPPYPKQFRTWLQGHGVSSVIVDDRAREKYGSLLVRAGFGQVYAGQGVSVWRPPAT